MENIRVYIAEDDTILADSLQASITLQPNIKVVGKATSPEELYNRFIPEKAHILLLDIFKPYSKFLKLILDLKEKAPGLGIIILSSRSNYHFAMKTVEAGVNGYIYKFGNSLSELCEIIIKVYDDPNVKILRLPPKNAVENEASEVRNELTRTELQVITLLIQGFRAQEIAFFMGKINNKESYSKATVYEHKKSINRKLADFGVTNDASLGFKMAQWNLLQGDELETFENE